MPTHRSHDREYLEPPRHDELPAGTPAPPLVEAGSERRADGTFALGAKTAQSKGGQSHRGEPRLVHRLTAPKLPPKYAKQAAGLRTALRAEIASTVGGGVCGIAASLFVKFAAQKTAAAEDAYQRGDFETHRKLSESARMDLLYAREHAAKEAENRKRTGGQAAVLEKIFGKKTTP